MTPNRATQEWFSRRKLGLFLHFGLYAIEGWHEQDQMRRRIPRATYERLIRRFHPARFDPDRILDLAESVGMEYVCLTTKHHDGFCLWDTRETAFNVMNSPCGRDLVRELADACHRRNFPLGLYYSVADWHHPNYPNEGRHHELPGPQPGDHPDWGRYVDYLTRQVRELCSNYGEVRYFFWDMNVPKTRDPAINDMLRSLQPRMVINNRGFDEGDFGTPEREYQSEETGRLLRFERPTEACNSVGTQSWGFRKKEDYYSAAFLMQSIDAAMARGGNYLLNVGPDATGEIPARAERILRRIGDWYGRVRESFGDAEPASERTSNRQILLTRRGTTLYAHIPPPAVSEAVTLPPISKTPIQVRLLNTGRPLPCRVDLLPVHWASGSRMLILRKLPVDRRADEPLVARLDFDELPAESATDGPTEFRG
ncbi:MAG: alpha-L-fucosidase [Kiritimatiellia bacterium]|nr:alpha-L-fucosidase [Kiritimatiellia bacterium]